MKEQQRTSQSGLDESADSPELEKLIQIAARCDPCLPRVILDAFDNLLVLGVDRGWQITKLREIITEHVGRHKI